jgi:hypothetical protein
VLETENWLVTMANIILFDQSRWSFASFAQSVDQLVWRSDIPDEAELKEYSVADLLSLTARASLQTSSRPSKSAVISLILTNWDNILAATPSETENTSSVKSRPRAEVLSEAFSLGITSLPTISKTGKPIQKSLEKSTVPEIESVIRAKKSSMIVNLVDLDTELPQQSGDTEAPTTAKAKKKIVRSEPSHTMPPPSSSIEEDAYPVRRMTAPCPLDYGTKDYFASVIQKFWRCRRKEPRYFSSWCLLANQFFLFDENTTVAMMRQHFKVSKHDRIVFADRKVNNDSLIEDVVRCKGQNFHVQKQMQVHITPFGAPLSK